MPDDVSLPATRASNRDLQTMRFEEALEVYTPSLADALPDHIPLQRFKRVVLTAVNLNPDLRHVDRRSLFNACVKCAHDGLYPDGREAALVVYETNVKTTNERGMDMWQKVPVASYLPMIAGIRKRMRNSGEVVAAIAEVVYRNDKFRVIKGIDGRIEHEPPALDEDRGDPVGCYAQIKLRTGEILQEVMTKREIEHIRDTFSRGASGARSPWRTSESEMWRKTVLRRCSKSAPSDSDLDRLMSRDDEPLDEPHPAALPPSRPSRMQFSDARQQRIEDYVATDDSERDTDDPNYAVPAESAEPPEGKEALHRPEPQTTGDPPQEQERQRRRRRTKAEMEAARAAEASEKAAIWPEDAASNETAKSYPVVDPEGEVHEFASPAEAANHLCRLLAAARSEAALDAVCVDNEFLRKQLNNSIYQSVEDTIEHYRSLLAIESPATSESPRSTGAVAEPDRQAQPEPTPSPPVQAPAGQRPDYRIPEVYTRSGEIDRAWFVALFLPKLRQAKTRQEHIDRIADNADITAGYMQTLQPAARIAAMKELDDIESEIRA